MKTIFSGIYEFLAHRRWLALGLFVLLTTCFLLLALQLKLDSNLRSMMPKSEKKDLSELLYQNKQLDRILVSVSLKDSSQRDPDALIAFTEELANELQHQDIEHLIERIEQKQDEEEFLNLVRQIQSGLPYLLEETDYERLDSLIQEDAMQHALEQNYRTLVSPGGVAMKQLLLSDPLGWSMPAFRQLQQLKLDDAISLYDGYLVNENENQLLFFIHPRFASSQTKENHKLEPFLQDAIRKVSGQPEMQAIDCHYFGGTLVASGNAKQMQQDTYLTLGITIALLLILFITFFRRITAPLLVMIPVVFGGSFGMAMMYLIQGKVSMMALGASSVILGIAVNYSLHFLSHLRHSGNKKETILELTQPMTIGSFTTIAAFLSLTLLHAPVLRELGLFTAFNLIGSSVCTLIFLPHFIGSRIQPVHKKNWFDQFSQMHFSRKRWFLLLIFALVIGLSFFANQVSFTEDMMQMNYLSEELKTNQEIINQRHTASLNNLFCISEGNTLNEAIQQAQLASTQLKKLKKEGSIRQFQPISYFLLSEEELHKRTTRWNTFWTPKKQQEFFARLDRIGHQIGFSPEAFQNLKQLVREPISSVDTAFQNSFRNLLSDQIMQEDGKFQIIQLVKTTQELRKKALSEFRSDAQTLLTDRQSLTSRFVQYIRDDFYRILFFTSFIVFFTILITYGRIEIALISFIPMVLTWICILGLMALLRIEFNIINIIISTLIFGLGDDYSIFITDGLLEKYKYGKQKITSIRTSIYLSALTTMIGLGVLVFAKHPALKSIALVSVIGILSILFISQSIQPVLFDFFIQKRADKKRHPFTLWSFIKTIFAFTYYVVGCQLLTIVGFILTKCLPFAKDRMKYIFHVMLCKMMWSLLYIMGNVRKRFENKKDADFSKPSILIANHASFLDLLRIISLHPKILLMTNQWVWRSPVFGALVRMADYYPVEEGAEFSVERLAYWVERGYSIAVFPEGTRSYDDTVKRFHKGAFYLAEKLNLDIQPVLFQGIGYTMRKGDFLLKDGEINVKFLPRIGRDDTRYGATYRERAKWIGRMFRSEHLQYSQEREVPAYYREQLIRNFQYKGPVLEWYCRIKSRLEINYTPIEKLVTREGRILNLGCGYGFLDFILHWTSTERTILGLDYDAEKIEVAKNCFGRGEQLQFMAGDILDFPNDTNYDCILIMDVLHYLVPEKQAVVCERCIQQLNPGGRLIIRDGLADYKERHRGTELTEIFSTRLFGFNKTSNKLHFINKAFLESLAQRHQLQLQWIDDTKLTSNITTVFTKGS